MRERALGTANKAIGFGRMTARPGAGAAGEPARSHRAGSLYTQALAGQPIARAVRQARPVALAVRTPGRAGRAWRTAGLPTGAVGARTARQGIRRPAPARPC